MKKRQGVILIIVIVVAIAGALIGYRRMYPYGHSHCCILGMQASLAIYAQDNDGKYPAGGETPEADLSLLFKSEYSDANTLRGMIVPEKTVQEILNRGGVLGPDSCGWHYVPGLTLADDPELAILWCKSALTHNGRRSKDGGREVIFVGGFRQWISGNEWPDFLDRQMKLMKNRSEREKNGEPLVTGMIELPDGRRIERVDSSYSMTEESMGPNSSGSGSSSGTEFSSSKLNWYRAPLVDGHITRTLSFSDLVSEPVTVTFLDGVPNTHIVVFKMRSK